MIPGQHFFLHSPLFLTNSVKGCLCFTLFCCFVHSEFQDIFDVDYFIASLREEVRILKELPPRLKKRVEQGFLRSMPPVSWSDIGPLLFSLFFRFSQKLPSTSFSQNLVSKICTTI
jgi:hypothetical protein